MAREDTCNRYCDCDRCAHLSKLLRCAGHVTAAAPAIPVLGHLFEFDWASALSGSSARLAPNFATGIPLQDGRSGGVVLLANFIGCGLAGLILQALIGARYEYWDDLRRSYGLSLVLSAIAVAFVSMYESQQSRLKTTAMQLKTKEVERERALKLATEARLSSLEARIHPHFLFNTLNSVSSLIHEDPLQAERIVTRLAELLRFSLDAAPGGLVPLERELQIVEDYLEIEKARFGVRLNYKIDVAPELGEVPVPPLSVQTLVENSVKHAVGPRGRGASVTVRATQQDACLRIEVLDDGPGFANLELPAGHGLNNLGERLAGLFGERAKLEIQSNDLRTVVVIEIPHRTVLREDTPRHSEETIAAR